MDVFSKGSMREAYKKSSGRGSGTGSDSSKSLNSGKSSGIEPVFRSTVKSVASGEPMTIDPAEVWD
jgi:hypothetical protein